MVDQLVTRRMTVRPSPSFSQVLKRTRSASASTWALSRTTNCWLVGAFAEEGAAGLAQDAAQLVGHGDGVATQLVIQPVGEQRVELHAEQTPLGQQGTVLLGVGEEVAGHAAAREHDRLAAERPAFGAADVEGVGEARDVGQGDVGVGSGQAIGEARTVQVQRDVVAAAEGRQLLQLGQRVQRAQLGGVRDEHHAGEHHVGETGVGVEGLQVGFHVAARSLPSHSGTVSTLCPVASMAPAS